MSGSKSSVDSWTGFVPRQCEARYYCLEVEGTTVVFDIPEPVAPWHHAAILARGKYELRQVDKLQYLDLLSMGCDRLNYDIKVRYNTLDLTQYESCSHEERLCLTTHGV